jgi:rubredoxin
VIFTNQKRRKAMQKWECPCGYIYDPEIGDPDNTVAPGTAWEDVPRGWVCPLCGAEKESFSKVD